MFPSVLIIPDTGSPVVIPDDQGQATLAQVQAAQQAAESAATAKEQAIADAKSNLSQLASLLGPSMTSASTDLATLQASSDPLAPIFVRILEGVTNLANAVNDVVTVLEL